MSVSWRDALLPGLPGCGTLESGAVPNGRPQRDGASEKNMPAGHLYVVPTSFGAFYACAGITVATNTATAHKKTRLHNLLLFNGLQPCGERAKLAASQVTAP